MSDKLKYKIKIDKYDDRHRFWSDKTLEQFGIANNFFLAIGIGILGYIVDSIEDLEIEKILFTFCNIEWKLTLLIISGLLALFSISLGTTTLISRLHDLRLTRHISRVRKKAYGEKNGWTLLSDDFIQVEERFFPMFLNFLSTITSRKYFIWDNDFHSRPDSLKKRFYNLRKRSLLLGRFSWKCFNYQILILLLSIFTFTLRLFI